MAKKKRKKQISTELVEKILKYKGQPVKVPKGYAGFITDNMPPRIYEYSFASGETTWAQPYCSESIPSGESIGGMDVYRNAPDDPVNLNKDWYPIVKVGEAFYTDGPIKPDDSNEHWRDDIPPHLKKAKKLK